MSDFFDTNSGNAPPLRRSNRWVNRMRDWLLDAELALRMPGQGKLQGAVPDRQKILIVGVVVPSRAEDIHQVIAKLCADSRHDISVSTTPMQDRGKFENIDAAINTAPHALTHYDWLIITDDDITFAPGFLDRLIDSAAAAELDISQPAHAFESYTTYAITKRQRGSLVRETSFVEIGPLTLLRARAFANLIPFPSSRWCYGIDVLWSEIADAKHYRMGIIDATPIKHQRPVGAAYDMDAAIAEGRSLLSQYRVTRSRDEVFAKNKVVIAAP